MYFVSLNNYECTIECKYDDFKHRFKKQSKLFSSELRQGSRLGPLSFIVMIDDLRPNCEVHKFVDDTTLSELITPSSSPSNMTDYLSSLLTWTADNDMQLNTSKTKEMILGRIDSTSIPSLSTPGSSWSNRTCHYLQVTWPSS